MNIKKIILAEINDFDWVKDIPGEVRITDSSQIKVGDRVRMELPEFSKGSHLGTIVDIGDDGFYMVTFDERFSAALHSGDSDEDPTNSSYYLNLSDIDDWDNGNDVIYLV